MAGDSVLLLMSVAALIFFCIGVKLGMLLLLEWIYDDCALPRRGELAEELRFLRTVRRIRDIAGDASDAMLAATDYGRTWL